MSQTTVTRESFTFSLTEAAAAQIEKVIAKNKLPETAGLRAGAVEGGCSGFNYNVEIVDGPNHGDLILERHGARVFIDDFSLQLVSGMTVDWISSMMESRFTFENPNATGSCGCGVSFSTD
jgi:iron-sulfur cluster assembly accessory protein